MEFTFRSIWSYESICTVEADSFEEAKKKLDDPEIEFEDKDYILKESYCMDENEEEYAWNPYDD